MLIDKVALGGLLPLSQRRCPEDPMQAPGPKSCPAAVIHGTAQVTPTA
jgi:hypothetical protein